MTTENTPRLRYEGILSLGFLAAAIGIVAAYTDPATGYEISIYGATPTTFWAGIGGGFLATLYVAGSAPDAKRLVRAAFLLATICGIAVVALPLVRSYFYYGSGDSLTHLGWAREIERGVIAPTDIVYPGLHLLGIFTADIFGRDLTDSLQLVPLVVFPLVYVVFTALCVRLLTGRPWALIVGVVSAVLFVPINQVAVHIVSHPSSQAILFLPFVLYSLVRFLLDDADGHPLTTPAGLLLALVTIGLLFVHPQETLSFVTLLGAIWLVQIGVRRWDPDHEIASHRSVFAHLVLLGAADLLWAAQHERAGSRFSSLVLGLVSQGPQTLSETAQRGASLASLGSSIEVLFVKLFAGTVLFCCLAAALMLLNLRGGPSAWRSRRNSIVTYLTAGLVPPTIGFVLVFVGDQGDHYFRFLGFIMVSVTLLAATALSELPARAHRWMVGTSSSRPQPDTRASDGGYRSPPRWLRLALAFVFVGLLAVQLVVVHPSPYMYQSNDLVTEQQMKGHEIAFEHHDGDTPMLGLRNGVQRFVDAQYGGYTAQERLDFPGYRDAVPGRVFNGNLSATYDDPQYLTLETADYRREVGLYRGLRYDRSGFRALARNQNVSKVQDNGGFVLYRIDAT